jgi:hypothetical protein
MPVNRLSCVYCVYFQPAPPTGPVDLKRVTADHGICRRFPPTVTMTPGGMMAMFPQIDRTHWCGEIQLAEDTVARLDAEDDAERLATPSDDDGPAVSHWSDGTPRR